MSDRSWGSVGTAPTQRRDARFDADACDDFFESSFGSAGYHDVGGDFDSLGSDIFTVHGVHGVQHHRIAAHRCTHAFFDVVTANRPDFIAREDGRNTTLAHTTPATPTAASSAKPSPTSAPTVKALI